ncbi:MAG: hypothetical protein DI587_18480 [Variovorax paradoxus]|nr:MAG: hypothetical protein DI583_18480 [Variovorax paradoxus]PZQ08453.1 MAG: hypothetical protein DI587_18480 [Variovorax paradoxus]
MSNTLVHFGPHDIRVIDDGTGTFEVVAKDVVEGIGATWNGNAAIAHVPDEWKGVRSVRTPGGMQEMAVLKEPGLYFYLGRSDKPAALPMQKWVSGEVLPSIRKTGSYTAKTTRPQTLSRNQVAASILLLRSAAEDLKLSPSAVLGGYQRLELQLGVTGLLPGYAVDASNSASGSSEETKSAAELLEIHGVGLSAIAFNRLLLQHGFIEERERPSSKGGTKKFKVCTNLEFGKNLTNPNNPRETQPHWYVRKFPELLDLVIPAKPKVATA